MIRLSIDAVLPVALLNTVAKMPVVVDAPSVDAAVVSPTVSAVLLFIKSIETLEFLASNDACIEVTESDDIISECSRDVSTPVTDNLSVVENNGIATIEL